MKPKILAIIPARGGSKGVPRKNIRDLAGKPLIAWVIEAALNSGVITKLVVSTEDKEIAEVAKKLGAEIVERPAELATDEAKTEPVMVHALEEVENRGFKPDYVSLIQCTSPFLTGEVIKNAVEKILQNPNKYDSVGTFYKSTDHAFKWKHNEETGHFVSEYPVMNRPRRQDLPPDPFPFRGAGAFYILKTSLFKDVKNRWGGNDAKIGGVEVSERDGMQIDTEFDLWLAGELMKYKISKGERK